MRNARDVMLGVRLYARGVRLWTTRPGLALLGLLPGVLTAWLFTLGFVVLVATLGRSSEAIASRLPGTGTWHDAARIGVAVGLLVGALVLAALTFVAVTSAIGQPLFEVISHRVDDAYGPVVEGPGERWWKGAVRGIAEGAATVAASVPLALGVAVTGWVPLVGAVLAWLLAASVGGWYLALELTSIPFERRGLGRSQRRRALARRRAVAVGFGATVFVASSFAPLAVVTMPLSVAGGTHLARLVLDAESQSSGEG